MSVPLPSPSTPLQPTSTQTQIATPASKPIPRSRPTPITTHTPGSPSSPSSSSFRKTATASGTARSIGFNTSASGGGGGGGGDNWRSRGESPKIGKPERTVGGFGEKKGGGGGGGGGISPVAREREREKESEKEKEVDAKAAALSHVPCRFFKAGACTAGDSCPFSHGETGKKEICQWFLKGSCKFGHKCALAHVRPGEPLSMDRKNKKESQREARGERPDSRGDRSEIRQQPDRHEEHLASPVPIRSALSSSIQSPPAPRGTSSSSPMREPYGPPSGGFAGGSSPGFAKSPNFAASPSRPSPLSASFNPRQGQGAGPLSLKAGASPSLHSPLRPPTTAAAAGFSRPFSHASLAVERPGPPLSASFADSPIRRSIWAPSQTPDEPLSPRRPNLLKPAHSRDDVFLDDDDDDAGNGADFLPSSLDHLLNPEELARVRTRRDSNGSFSASPSRGLFVPQNLWNGGERLAQSAGATMGPGGFLQTLWNAEGTDARKSTTNTDFAFGPTTAQPVGPRKSLLTQQQQQRAPISPQRQIPKPQLDAPYFRPSGDPSSPSAKALQEHAPGQSLPGGLATALSRLHLHGSRPGSGLARGNSNSDEADVEEGFGIGKGNGDVPLPSGKEEADEGVFAMDG